MHAYFLFLLLHQPVRMTVYVYMPNQTDNLHSVCQLAHSTWTSELNSRENRPQTDDFLHLQCSVRRYLLVYPSVVRCRLLFFLTCLRFTRAASLAVKRGKRRKSLLLSLSSRRSNIFAANTRSVRPTDRLRRKEAKEAGEIS